MWGRLTGKSDGSERKDKDEKRRTTSGSSSTGAWTRRRAESVVSSSSSRRPTRTRSGSESRPAPSSSRNSYAPPASSVASFATALESSRGDGYLPYDGQTDGEIRHSRRREDRSPTRSIASARRDRSRSRDRDDKKKSKSKSDKKRRSSGRTSTIVDDPSSIPTSRGVEELMRAGPSFSTQVSTPGFTQFPGQVGAPSMSGVPPPIHPAHPMTSHVADQFPGQNPSQFTEPYMPGHSFGAAADYYGDQGESVQHQPGVRPEPPSVIIPQDTPHLHAASVQANPPEETGSGAAAEFFGSGSAAMPGAFEDTPAPPKPPRPSSHKPSSSSGKPDKPSKMSSTAALAAGAALGYALGHGNNEHQSSSSSFYQQNHNASHAATDGSYNATYHTADIPPPKPPRPGHESSNSSNSHSHSHSHAPMYAAGAGPAATAYDNNHHSSQLHSSSMPGAFPGDTQVYGGQGSLMMGNMAMDTKREQSNPISKLVDWWKDYEDVVKMEEYTEYIGVCRGCFDSPVQSAPRKHNYRRKRSGELRPSGIQKESRYHNHNHSDKDSRYYYHSSDAESKRHGTKSVLAAGGLTGYGLAKVGKALWNQNNDFDDTYSIKSGRETRSSTSRRHRSRSRSRSYDRHRSSYDNRSEIRYGGDFRDSISTGVTGSGKIYKTAPHHRKTGTHSSRSRSSSPDRKSGILGAVVGASVASSVASHNRSNHRRNSRSSENAFVRHPRHSSDYEYKQSRPHRRASHRSSRSSLTSGSIIDISRTSKPQSSGFFGGFFSPPPEKQEKRRVTHSKKRKGFFNFGNASSSSSGSDLAFGTGYVKRRNSAKRRNSDEKFHAALVGWGATTAAITAAQHGRIKHGRPHQPEVVTVRRKQRSKDHSRRSSHSAYSADDDEEGWESIPEDDHADSSSVDSGLAFGDLTSLKGKKSSDSLLSDASGTNKWNWRWGFNKSGKKKKKVASMASHENIAHPSHHVGSVLAGAATGAAYSQVGSAMSSASSVPTLQSVYAQGTQDPNRFDTVTRMGSVPGTQTLPVTSQAQGVYVQPQPIPQIPGSMYYPQPSSQPAHVEPSGMPVFSNIPPQPTYPAPLRSSMVEQHPPLPPRRANSSTTLSSWKHDALVAGATVGITAIGASALKSGSRFQDSPTNVRFKLTEEQAERESLGRKVEDDRQRRAPERKYSKEQEAREDEPKREEARREEARREEARREEVRREEARREEARREEARREETKREEAHREEARREEIRRDEARQEEFSREEARREEARLIKLRREEARREEARREEARREEARREEARREEARREEARREEARREELRREEAHKEVARREESHKQEVERLKRERAIQQEANRCELPDRRAREAWEFEEAERAEKPAREVRKSEEAERRARAALAEAQRAKEARLQAERVMQERQAAYELIQAQKAEEARLEAERAEKERQEAFEKEQREIASHDERKRSQSWRESFQPIYAEQGRRLDGVHNDTNHAPDWTIPSDTWTPSVVEPVYTDSTPVIKPVEPGKAAEVLFDDDIFNRDLFKKKDPTRAASKVLEDWEERYTAAPVSPAEFFAPPELKDHSGTPSVRSDPNGGADILVYDGHEFATTKGPPYPAPYAFKTTGSSSSSSHIAPPFPVPPLKLIPPTPEGSRAGSVKGSSLPPSPVIPTTDNSDSKKDEIPGKEPSTKVTWGEDQTHHYEVPTPMSYREEWASDHETNYQSDPSRDEIVVEVESPSSGTSRRTYPWPEISKSDLVSDSGYQTEPTVTLDNRGFAVQTPAEGPSPRDREHGNGIYQAPFFETVSDLGITAPSHTQHQSVEKPITEEVEPMHIPGSFDDELESPVAAALDSNTSTTADRPSENDDKPKRHYNSEEETQDDSFVKPEHNLSKKKKKKRRVKTDKKAGTEQGQRDSLEDPTNLNDTEPTYSESHRLEYDLRNIGPMKGTGAYIYPTPESAPEGGIDLGPSQTNDRQEHTWEPAPATIYHDDAVPSRYINEPITQPRVPDTNDRDEEADAVDEWGGNKRSKKKKMRSDKSVAPVDPSSIVHLPEKDPPLETSQTFFEDKPYSTDPASLTRPEELPPLPNTVDDDLSPKHGYGKLDHVFVGRRDSRDEFFSAESDDNTIRPSKGKEPAGDNGRPISPVAWQSRLDEYDIHEESGYGRRDDERSESRDRDYARESPEGKHRKKHRRHRDYRTPDDYDARSVVSEVVDGASSDRRRKHKHRNSDRTDSPGARSVATSEPGDIRYSSRKSKRSSEVFDDTAPVISSSSRYEESDTKSKKDKEKPSSGLFGQLFGGRKSTDVLSEVSNKSKSRDQRDENDEDEERKHRKKKHHRSSTYGSDHEDPRPTDHQKDGEIDNSERKHRKKKHHRSSAYGSDNDDARSIRSSKSEPRIKRPTYGSDNDDARSTRSMKSERREKRSSHHRHDTGTDAQHQATSKYHYSRRSSEPQSEESFLGERAVAAGLLPEDKPSLNVNTEPSRLYTGVDIPGDRPEYPLPTLDESRSISPYRVDLPSRPITPLQDSRGFLERLTGLPSSHLQATSDNLPPLPQSRPNSPEMSPEQAHSPLVALRASSTTAVPLRFRRPPSSPGKFRDLTIDPVTLSSPTSSPLAPQRAKHAKSSSTEFKGEYRPLYLVEANRKSTNIEEDQVLPALPSSRETSEAPSERGTEDEYQSALESPHSTGTETFNGFFSVADDQQQWQESHEEIPGSQQTTPRALTFPTDVLRSIAEPEDLDYDRSPSMDSFTSAILTQDVQPLSPAGVALPPSPLGPLAQKDYEQYANLELPPLPALTDPEIHDLEDNAITLSDSRTVQKGYDSDFMGGEPGPEDIPLPVPSLTEIKDQEPESPSIPTTSSTSQQSEKGEKAKQDSESNSIPQSTQPALLTAKEQQKPRESNVEDPMESWFSPPVTLAEAVAERATIEPAVDVEIKAAELDSACLRQDSVGKGKKKKGKKGRGSRSGTLSAGVGESVSSTSLEEAKPLGTTDDFIVDDGELLTAPKSNRELSDLMKEAQEKEMESPGEAKTNIPTVFDFQILDEEESGESGNAELSAHIEPKSQSDNTALALPSSVSKDTPDQLAAITPKPENDPAALLKSDAGLLKIEDLVADAAETQSKKKKKRKGKRLKAVNDLVGSSGTNTPIESELVGKERDAGGITLAVEVEKNDDAVVNDRHTGVYVPAPEEVPLPPVDDSEFIIAEQADESVQEHTARRVLPKESSSERKGNMEIEAVVEVTEEETGVSASAVGLAPAASSFSKVMSVFGWRKAKQAEVSSSGSEHALTPGIAEEEQEGVSASVEPAVEREVIPDDKEAITTERIVTTYDLPFEAIDSKEIHESEKKQAATAGDEPIVQEDEHPTLVTEETAGQVNSTVKFESSEQAEEKPLETQPAAAANELVQATETKKGKKARKSPKKNQASINLDPSPTESDIGTPAIPASFITLPEKPKVELDKRDLTGESLSIPPEIPLPSEVEEPLTSGVTLPSEEPLPSKEPLLSEELVPFEVSLPSEVSKPLPSEIPLSSDILVPSEIPLPNKTEEPLPADIPLPSDVDEALASEDIILPEAKRPLQFEVEQPLPTEISLSSELEQPPSTEPEPVVKEELQPQSSKKEGKKKKKRAQAVGTLPPAPAELERSPENVSTIKEGLEQVPAEQPMAEPLPFPSEVDTLSTMVVQGEYTTNVANPSKAPQQAQIEQFQVEGPGVVPPEVERKLFPETVSETNDGLLPVQSEKKRKDKKKVGAVDAELDALKPKMTIEDVAFAKNKPEQVQSEKSYVEVSETLRFEVGPQLPTKSKVTSEADQLPVPSGERITVIDTETNPLQPEQISESVVTLEGSVQVDTEPKSTAPAPSKKKGKKKRGGRKAALKNNEASSSADQIEQENDQIVTEGAELPPSPAAAALEILPTGEPVSSEQKVDDIIHLETTEQLPPLPGRPDLTPLAKYNKQLPPRPADVDQLPPLPADVDQLPPLPMLINFHLFQQILINSHLFQRIPSNPHLFPSAPRISHPLQKMPAN
ncbi:hypothetical protein GQ43DRAFT_44934 [Delitschia confertaspora ATCC 74209]|uniref:Involucrin repeat protein n=1 Tax=Delitschia confertaspora ATCC 74209 TaxID=1513339 RepID=A0A9P4JN08_9PLEO|nr:hypothetical protein GQ43DRAFT_44934 [Delitschia confertaspora ATCC 74209]